MSKDRQFVVCEGCETVYTAFVTDEGSLCVAGVEPETCPNCEDAELQIVRVEVTEG